ncbi:MAG: hypothetical protein QGG64_13500 [Candidatus Latescibacteria bacterium]|jgi:hypothetical protein|nr:hypothetical protein [Candidatus Latescibacterota bacterium]
MKNLTLNIWIWGFLLVSAVAGGARAQTLTTAPVKWVDADNRSISKPKEIEENLIWDIVDHTFFYEVGKTLDLGWSARRLGNITKLVPPRQADNINVLDEVPNSSWYTNRHFIKRMTLENLENGSGWAQPDTSGVWEIISGKFEGLAPGFTVRDKNKDIYFLKFDAKDYEGLATTAEVVSTKILYAAGFNVPQNSVVFFRPEWLTIGSETKVADGQGGRRLMAEKDLDAILASISKQPDGRIRCVASKVLEGIPVGVFDFHGRRDDDLNDRVEHQHRRELRGLRVIASWINDVDRRAANTLNMYVRDNRGRQYIKHYLIDMGATLGSSTVAPRVPKSGHEYFVDFRYIVPSILGLGLHRRRWEDALPIRFPSIGYLESDVFPPGRWVTNYPNPAFQRCTNRDGYWGAKIAMSFTDEDLAAIVKTGLLPDKKAETALIQLLKERRDKVGRYWFERINTLDRFWVDRRGLHFEDLAITGNLASVAETQYVYRFSDRKGNALDIGGQLQGEYQIQIPENLPSNQYYGIEIRTIRAGWARKYVRVYFHLWAPGHYQIVRVDREE